LDDFTREMNIESREEMNFALLAESQFKEARKKRPAGNLKMKAIAVTRLGDIGDGTTVGVPLLYHSMCHIFTFKGLRHTNVLF